MDFNLPSVEDCEIKIKDGDKVLGVIDCLEVVLLRSRAIEKADKLGLEDFWNCFLDDLEEKYHLGIKNKSIAVALYSQANEMLVSIKKKSSQLLNQLDSMDFPEDGEDEN